MTLLNTDSLKRQADRADLWFQKKSFGFTQRFQFYEKLNSYVKDGIPLIDALRSINRRHRLNKKPQAKMTGAWLEAMSRGKTFSSALAGWAPAEERAMIASGEASGNESQAFQSLVSTMQSAKENRSLVRKAVLALAFNVLVLVAAILVLSAILAPSLREAIDQDYWGPMATRFFGTSQWIVDNGPALAFVLAIIGAAITWSLPRWNGRGRSIANRIPPWSIYQYTQSTFFTTTLSGMMSAGMTFDTTLKTMARYATRYQAHHIRMMLSNIGAGRGEGESLATGFFPKEMEDDIIDYADASPASFADNIVKLGARSSEQAQQSIGRIMGVLKVIILALVAFYLIWFFASLGELMTNAIGDISAAA